MHEGANSGPPGDYTPTCTTKPFSKSNIQTSHSTAILKILIYLFFSVNFTGPQYKVFVKSTLTLCTNILKLLAPLLLPYIISILTLVAHLDCFLCCTCFDSFVKPKYCSCFSWVASAVPVNLRGLSPGSLIRDLGEHFSHSANIY